MESLTTLSALRTLLRWQNITEIQPDGGGGLRCFSVWPTGKWLPQIEFVFDHKVTTLIQLGFGPWHSHYERYQDERRNFRQAVAVARALINGSRCLLVERSALGKYLASGPFRISQLPMSLPAECARVERLVFDHPAVDVDIDFSRYYRGKYSLIEHSYREKLKRIFKGTKNERLFD